jgi:conjugative transfer region protein (TIGR03750 family)
MKSPDFTPDRLNEHPPIMRGCTWDELRVITIRSFLISACIGLILAFYFGNYSTLMASIPVFMSILFWFLTGKLASNKNGRPIGYFTVLSKLKKQRRSGKILFVEHEGAWRISKD